MITGVPPQPARQYLRRRPPIPKQHPQLLPSQKHEQSSQENLRCSHKWPVDQGSERHGDGVRKQKLV